MVGITGSNGKSTTTAMTGALLAGAGFAVEVCGNIGRPLRGGRRRPAGRIFVVELSSFQLETIDHFRPRAAALLNISPDHLDRHGDLAGYLAAKQRIFLNQGGGRRRGAERRRARGGGQPRRPPAALLLATASAGRSRQDGCRLVGDGGPRARGERDRELLFARRDLRLPGLHNLENAMAAALLARAVGAPAGGARAGARAPSAACRTGSSGSRRRAASPSYDDSKGTNVAATARSLEGFADAQRPPDPRRPQQGRRLPLPARRSWRARRAAPT